MHRLEFEMHFSPFVTHPLKNDWHRASELLEIRASVHYFTVEAVVVPETDANYQQF